MSSFVKPLKCSLLCTLYMCVFLSSRGFAAEVGTNPMAKVIELLTVMGKQIVHESKEDEVLYNTVRDAYNIEQPKSEHIIIENQDKLAFLQTDIEESKANRDGKEADFGHMRNDQAMLSADLSTGQKHRKEERDKFEQNKVTYTESLQQLNLAIDTLNEQMPSNDASASASSASSASFLSVAEGLKKTLLHNMDLSLNIAERETLDAFVRSVRSSSWRAPSFLQYGSQGPYGEFQSRSQGLLSMLKTLRDKVQTESDAADRSDIAAQKNFHEFESGLEEELENLGKTISDTKMSIAQEEQHINVQKTALMETQSILETERRHMDDLEKTFRRKTWAYKIRLGKRSDEAIALHEAQRILSADVAKAYIKAQTIGSVSFILAKKHAALRRKALGVVSHKSAPGLALLALKSTVRRTNPFTKVKSMIKGMVERLSEQQAKETTHAAFCDKEMLVTANNMERKKAQVEKLTSRLSALTANLDETNADLATAHKDLKEVTNTTAAAVALRAQEQKTAVAAIKQFKDAAALLRRGLRVLKGYYQKDQGGASSETTPNAMKQRHALGNGVIGILEVAIDDFDTSYGTAKSDEDAAVAEFKEMQQDSAVRVAVFQKDVELQSRRKVALEGDQMSMSNDLKAYQEELQNLGTYSDKLKAQCTIKGPSYEERKAKREVTVKSLKEALSIISSERQ